MTSVQSSNNCRSIANIINENGDTLPFSVIENVNPAKTMEYLSNVKFSVWADANVFDHPWWKYISRKYPALKYLNVTSSWHQLSSIRAEHQDSQTSRQSCFKISFHNWTSSFCRHSPVNGVLWPLLVKGIRKITLRDHPTPFFSERIIHEATRSLKQLTMWKFPSDLQQLKGCPQLQQLEPDSRRAGKSQ